MQKSEILNLYLLRLEISKGTNLRSFWIYMCQACFVFMNDGECFVRWFPDKFRSHVKLSRNKSVIAQICPKNIRYSIVKHDTFINDWPIISEINFIPFQFYASFPKQANAEKQFKNEEINYVSKPRNRLPPSRLLASNETLSLSKNVWNWPNRNICKIWFDLNWKNTFCRIFVWHLSVKVQCISICSH